MDKLIKKEKQKKLIKIVLVYAIILLVLLFTMFLSIWLGESKYKASFHDTFTGIFTGKNPIVNMFMQVRGPRTIIAVLTGMCLATAGVLLQSVTKNQLADASIIGVSTSTYLGHLICGMFMSEFGLLFSPLIATIFGCLIFGCVLYLSWDHGIKSNRILLVGVAFNAVIMLIILTIVLMSGLNASAKLMALIGSLAIPSTNEIIATIIYTFIGLMFAFLLIPKCNILALGDKIANGLGENINLLKSMLIFVSIFLCAVASKMVGITSFIGLLAPMCARKCLGNNHWHVVPLSALFGGLFVLLGDFTGRCIVNHPFSMPVGIITSIIGGIVFLVLLKRSFRYGH